MLTLLELPFCKVLMVEGWNAPSGRYFIAYRALDNFRFAMGLHVIDEFATFSSPIFFCPNSLLGKIYNAGITLGHNRDPEMGIDLGWPPLVIGYEAQVPELSDRWETELLEAIKKAEVQGSGGAKGNEIKIDEYHLNKLQIGNTEVFATDAPLLPKQLRRLAQKSNAPFSVAFSIANRLTSKKNSSPLVIKAASEALLGRIIELTSNQRPILR